MYLFYNKRLKLAYIKLLGTEHISKINNIIIGLLKNDLLKYKLSLNYFTLSTLYCIIQFSQNMNNVNVI